MAHFASGQGLPLQPSQIVNPLREHDGQVTFLKIL
jgi:hypothetical protein